MIPALLNEREAAHILRVKPCTVRNERIRGKLGYTKVGAQFFYKSVHLSQYLDEQEVLPCAFSDSNPDRSATTGRAKSRGESGMVILGALPRMTSVPDRHVAKALAQQTFKKHAAG